MGKLYSGTMHITFRRVSADNEDELYEKLEEAVAHWLNVDSINTEEEEDEEEPERDYYEGRY